MKGLHIRPEQAGIRASLFDLEAEIMELVWTRRLRRFAVGELQRALEAARPLAYTTVMTTLGRLHDKGLLTRERQGRRYLYSPAMGRDEFLRQAARDALDSLAEAGFQGASALLVERVAEADLSELDRLEALIQRRRAELDGEL